MHPKLAERLFRAGARLRNPSLPAEYERLKRSESLSRPALEQLQLERAQRFLVFVARHSPHYRKVFDAHGFVPERFGSVSDLSVLPIVEKSDIIGDNQSRHTDFHFDRIFVAETSGTSGSALEFRKNERWDSINRAHIMRSYDWYGVKPWERNGYLWGYDIAPDRARKVRLMDALQNRFRIFSYDRASVRQFAQRLRTATYLGGYSSMIYEVAKVLKEDGASEDRSLPRLRMVKGTSEMILSIYQAEAERAFGTRIVSEYGAAEAGLIAFECPRGSMHINIEDVVLETTDEGDLLVTNLASESFPIIRYRLGDRVVLSGAVCSCGRAHPVLGEILGRRGSAVVGRAGRYPSLTFYYVFKNLAIRHGVLLNYRASQHEAGRVSIAIEGVEHSRHEPLVRVELDKYFGTDIESEIRFVAAFERTRRKPQYFESHLGT